MITITIERTILDRLIEAWDSTVLPTHRDGMMQERMEDLRAELAKPVEASYTATQLAAMVLSDCGISTDYAALHMLVAARIARHEEELIDSLKKLAKPVQKEPITLDQFRAIAHRTATTYRHRTDPEKSSYAFVDGSSLDDFWRKVCEAIQTTPAWHDAPTCPGLWVLDDGTALVLESRIFPKAFDGLRWFGPIPQDKKGGAA